MAMELTSENVETVIKDCLFTDDEDQSNFVEVEGTLHTYHFHPERLELHREDIKTMLNQLPHQFFKSSGGGWTFLNACMREDGVQWTGLHLQQERLLCLGEGLGLVKNQLPKEMWPALPGGMPYYVINDD